MIARLVRALAYYLFQRHAAPLPVVAAGRREVRGQAGFHWR